MFYFKRHTDGHIEHYNQDSDIASELGILSNTTEAEPIYGWNGLLYLITDTMPEMPSELVDENFRKKVSDYRKSKELTIVTLGDLSALCDTGTVAGLTECIEIIKDKGGVGTVSWHGPNSSELANIEQLQELRVAVVDIRQQARRAEPMVISQHADTPYTSDKEWQLDFDLFMEGDEDV